MTEKRAVWRRLASAVLDLVYPGCCHLCENPVPGGRALCEECSNGIPSLREPFCEMCGEEFDGAIDTTFSCSNCRGQKFSFEFARPGVPRSEGAMQLVRALKYRRQLDVAVELAGLAARAFQDQRLAPAVAQRWPLVPVPLHRSRWKWRQFNQAREIALPLGRELGLPVSEMLVRVRRTETQTRLSRNQRKKNLKGAFQPGRQITAAPGVILVDDVFTTGSTVHECARVLRKAGVQKVIVVTAVRG